MGREESVTFKGTRTGIALVLQAEAEFATILAELREKLAKAGDFFAGAAVTVTIERPLAPDEAAALIQVLCVDHGLRLAGVANPAAAPAVPARPGAPDARRPVAPVRRSPSRPKDPEQEETLLVRRTVRSGQRIAYDGNVVILGDVNPGGEVVASGDIIVIGTLRGTAHAGASGNTAAVVTALRLMPTQLRIAHLITRAPDGKVTSPGTPEIARIKDEAVVVQELAL